jgi:hypothetical protein
MWVLLVLILLACAALRAGMAWQAEGIARDGHTYIRMARQWWHDPAAVIHNYPYHPGYPAAMAIVHTAFRLSDTPMAWRVAGVLVAGAASILAMLAAWFWCRMAFGWRTACIATLLFGMTRKWSALGADVLSDSLAICPMIWSLVVGVWATRAMRQKPGRGVLLLSISGLLGGLGYCVRPEAAVVPCIVVVMLLADQLLRGSWRRALLSLGVAFAAVAAVAVPYMLLIGDVTKKKRLLDMLNPSGLLAALPTGLGTLVQQIFESMHPVLGVLLCVWLVAFIVSLTRRKSNGPDPVRPAAPTGAWILMVFVTWAMMMISLKRTAGYMSYRHVMFLAIALLPLAGEGLVILADWLRRVVGKVAPPACALAVAFSVVLATHALQGPLYQGIGAYQAAAARLVELARPGDGIVTDTRSMEFELLDIQRESELQGVRLDWRVVRAPTGLKLDEISAVMDQNHAAWIVIQLPRAAREAAAWLAQIDQVGLTDLASWPIPGSPDDVHVLACP